MGAIANRIIGQNAQRELAAKKYGIPGQVLPRGAKGQVGAPAIHNMTRVPLAGRVTGNGDTPKHNVTG